MGIFNSDNTIVRVVAKNSWIEGNAIQQLEKTAELPDIRLAVGLPDLHAGRGYPIGAAFLSETNVYGVLGPN